MKRRKIVVKMLEVLESGVHPTIEVEVKQKRPYTVAEVTCLDWMNADGDHVQGLGFSKVCRPDQWDEQTGATLATAKAVGDLADRLVADPSAWSLTY